MVDAVGDEDERLRLLAVYDEQLRGGPEVATASGSRRLGPVWLARWGGHGVLTYSSLAGLTGADVDDLVRRAGEHFAAAGGITEWEWKTRGHDQPADLGDRLRAAGLAPEEVETVMLGEADPLTRLATDVPPGVHVLRADVGTDREDWLARAAALQQEAFGRGPTTEEVLAEFDGDALQAGMWVAAAGEQVLAAGRVEVVPGTECAGLWGGVVHPDHRGRGLYRALVAARAGWCVERGVRYLHSDCTVMSRPILERAGLRQVTTTTPYVARVADTGRDAG